MGVPSCVVSHIKMRKRTDFTAQVTTGASLCDQTHSDGVIDVTKIHLLNDLPPIPNKQPNVLLDRTI
jgi:hypothetical protein